MQNVLHNQILLGNALEMLRTLPDECVQMCVTSPPYWGLRDYGVEGQIGLEATPEEYISKMVDVFHEVRRVLRQDGTLWLNMGDSYNAAGRRTHGTRIGYKQSTNRASAIGADANRATDSNLKPKDLIGIPWALAFALRDDRWHLRSDIIWHKSNPMPESVKDRPTKSHEYLFLLSKQERYYYDADSIKVKASPDSHARYARGRSDYHKWADGGPGNQTLAKTMAHMRETAPMDRRKPGVNPKCVEPGSGIKQNTSFSASCKDLVDFRNIRTVWTLSTEAFPETHFATFPKALVEPCILAGSRIGDVVLDPFMGSGTVAVVAQNLGRKWIGIELNPEYKAMAERRIKRECAQINMFHSKRQNEESQ